MTSLPDHPSVGTRGTFYGVFAGEQRQVQGTITGARRTESAVQIDDGTYPGVQFRMKPDDGSRAFWSATFADVEAGPLAEDSPS